MKDRNPEDDHNKIEFHSKRIKELGIETFKKVSIGNVGGAAFAAEQAIAKYAKDQELENEKRREEREGETLKQTQKANRIADDANQLSRWKFFVSVIAIVASAWVAIALYRS